MRILSLPVIALSFFLVSLPESGLTQNIQADQELLRQQERERALRQQLETSPSVQLQQATPAGERLPVSESPCNQIQVIRLQGKDHHRFSWALNAANTEDDAAIGRCLGAKGIAIVIARIQNAILQRGYITTRVLATAQDLNTGTLMLTLLPGRIRKIRLADGSGPRANEWNAMPAQAGDLLNLRELEQGLENFKRVPTAEADIQIMPSNAADALPGDSDVIIQWKQALPWRLNLSFDDAGSKFNGKYQAGVTLSLDHWWRLNDLFYFSFNQDAGGGLAGPRGTQGHTVHYSLPFRNWLISATTSANSFHQSVAGLNQTITYSGQSNNSELRIARLLYRDGVRKTNASLRLWTRESTRFVEDAEVSDQHRRNSGWEFALAHRELFNSASVNATLAYRRGTGALQAMHAAEEAFGEGTSRMQVITADAQLALPFALGTHHLRYSAAWRAQWNRTPLLAEDRFAIGSRYTVRGFDGELLLTGDRGWLLRQELAIAIVDSGAEAFSGLDAGEVGGPASAVMSGTRLAGAVIGLRGSSKHLYWEAFVGTPLTKPETYRTSKVTSGFNLNLSF
jgi:hemolysin activation/secretion protein